MRVLLACLVLLGFPAGKVLIRELGPTVLFWWFIKIIVLWQISSDIILLTESFSVLSVELCMQTNWNFMWARCACLFFPLPSSNHLHLTNGSSIPHAMAKQSYMPKQYAHDTKSEDPSIKYVTLPWICQDYCIFTKNTEFKTMLSSPIRNYERITCGWDFFL